MNEEDMSGKAILDCMDAIGFTDRTKQLYEANAEFRLPKSKRFLGYQRVTFIVRDHGGFPEIDCDDEIRSFGIHHPNFRALDQTIRFDESEVELRISGEDYDFILSFKHFVGN